MAFYPVGLGDDGLREPDWSGSLFSPAVEKGFFLFHFLCLFLHFDFLSSFHSLSFSFSIFWLLPLAAAFHPPKKKLQEFGLVEGKRTFDQVLLKRPSKMK